MSTLNRSDEPVDSSGVSEFMEALQRGDEAEAMRLAETGADLFRRTERGADTLYFAAMGNSTSLLAFLLGKGVKPVSRNLNGNGRTTLCLLCRHGNLEAVQLLLDRGMKMTMAELDGELILEGIWGKNPRLLTFLLERGLSPDFQDHSSMGTALILLANWNELEMARVLLEAKANPNIQNKWGDSPLMDARRRGHAEMEQLLLRHGANSRRLPGPCHLCGKEFFSGSRQIGQSDFAHYDWRCSWCGLPTCTACSPGIVGRAIDEEHKICRSCWTSQRLLEDRLELGIFTIWRWAHRSENIGKPRMIMRCPECKRAFDLAHAVNTFPRCTFHDHVCPDCLRERGTCPVCTREKLERAAMRR